MGEAQNLYNRYLTVRQAVVMHNNVNVLHQVNLLLIYKFVPNKCLVWTRDSAA